MESRGDAYTIIEEVKSNHNICNKAGFTIWLCNLFRTKVSNNPKLYYLSQVKLKRASTSLEKHKSDVFTTTLRFIAR